MYILVSFWWLLFLACLSPRYSSGLFFPPPVVCFYYFPPGLDVSITLSLPLVGEFASKSCQRGAFSAKLPERGRDLSSNAPRHYY